MSLKQGLHPMMFKIGCKITRKRIVKFDFPNRATISALLSIDRKAGRACGLM
jgi:hypothetical protein